MNTKVVSEQEFDSIVTTEIKVPPFHLCFIDGAGKPTLEDFHQLWDSVPRTLLYSPSWANGTGYLDHACEDFMIPDGVSRFIDNHRRKAIVVMDNRGGQGLGGVVFFQRYSEKGPIVHNSSSSVQDFLHIRGGTTTDNWALRVVLGKHNSKTNQWSDSFHHRIKDLISKV